MCDRIGGDHDARTVRLPAGCQFDPGGIGKGLAAALVSADLVTAGIVGGCVSVGGDLRVWGPGPHDLRWNVAAADRTIAVTDAAVAPRGTALRPLHLARRRLDHLLDPDTPGPTTFEGPLHNQIPAPDRTKDNSTVWQADFSRNLEKVGRWVASKSTSPA